jgi:hypothetical protein
MHETPISLSSTTLAFGLGGIDHELPSHFSTNVWFPAPNQENPTAVQNDVDTHETERNSSSPMNAGFECDMMDHVAPSHISINESVGPPIWVVPTAIQNDVDTQDTERNSSFSDPGTGPATTDHDAPFHISVNVRGPLDTSV